MWIEAVLASFRFAGRGIAAAIWRERNFRIHLAATAYVTALGLLAELGAAQWCAILLCCGAVLAAELMNTAVETLCDAVSPGENPKIGAAKDAAAGGVLVLALAAVAVAGVVFLPWIAGGGLWAAQGRYPWLLLLFLISLPLAILWIRGWTNEH